VQRYKEKMKVPNNCAKKNSAAVLAAARAAEIQTTFSILL
jgi:hypothetical protein